MLGPRGVAGTQNPPSATGFERGALPFTSQASIAMGKTFAEVDFARKGPGGTDEDGPDIAGGLDGGAHAPRRDAAVAAGRSVMVATHRFRRLKQSSDPVKARCGAVQFASIRGPARSSTTPLAPGRKFREPPRVCDILPTERRSMLSMPKARSTCTRSPRAPGRRSAAARAISRSLPTARCTFSQTGAATAATTGSGIWRTGRGRNCPAPLLASPRFWMPDYYTVNGNTDRAVWFLRVQQHGRDLLLQSDLRRLHPDAGRGLVDGAGGPAVLFVVGSPAINNGGAPIYYYDFTHPGWAKTRRGSSISGSTTQLYAVNALGYIYLSRSESSRRCRRCRTI